MSYPDAMWALWRQSVMWPIVVALVMPYDAPETTHRTIIARDDHWSTDMFKRISHLDGLVSEDEILYATPFNYMFPDAAHSRLCLLPASTDTVNALRALGAAMANPGDTESEPLNSSIPAIFTYFGQFIDHDITARTDRDTSASMLGRNEPVSPRDPDEVVATLRNGRRPQLDLDSLFGDGPALVSSGGGVGTAPRSQSQVLYDEDLRLATFEAGGRRDLPRDASRTAVIPDARNDENLNISQLQFAFLKFYNRVFDALSGSLSNGQRHIRARQLTRWAYQHVVVHDYLKRVCDRSVIEDVLANGPRYFSTTAGRGDAFMPLEFSTAAFRFGHSMIRPSYRPNGSKMPIGIGELLGFAKKPRFFSGSDTQLDPSFQLDFSFFVGSSPNVQFARKLDTRIAQGLGHLTLGSRETDPVLSHLARSNLLRAYSLSIPTGQAMCDAMGLDPLTAEEMLGGEEPAIAAVLASAYFHHRTPLWYYVLREATVQQGGERLGELGSRIVGGTLIGLMKSDPNSYLNNRHDGAVNDDYIDVKGGVGGHISELKDILTFAEVL